MILAGKILCGKSIDTHIYLLSLCLHPNDVAHSPMLFLYSAFFLFLFREISRRFCLFAAEFTFETIIIGRVFWFNHTCKLVLGSVAFFGTLLSFFSHVSKAFFQDVELPGIIKYDLGT